MEKFATLLKRHPYLRFFASVQLAIPLLTTLGVVVAIGTIIESRYNTDYARLMIYDSTWFLCLLLLLWLNIFLSTLSRYPYRRQHIGFVIVHIGLMTLLIGGFVTRHYGIDGQLRVEEGAQSGQVMLGDLTVDLIDVQADYAIHAPFTRGLHALTQSSLDFLNEKFNSKIIVRQFVPFAEIHEGYAEGDPTGGGPVAIGFMLKNANFDVSEWLQSSERPGMQIGPATVRLIVDKNSLAATKKQSLAHAPPPVQSSSPHPTKVQTKTALGTLIVHDETSGQVLAEFPVARLKSGTVLGKGATLSAVKVYRHAVVANNRLAEGDELEVNPALELQIKSGNDSVREVTYAKYPNFNLTQHKGKSFGLKFEYQVEDDESSAAAGGSQSPESSTRHFAGMNSAAVKDEGSTATPGSRQGNVIEFHVDPSDGENVRLELYKDQRQVLSQSLAPGESVVTPWMGIKVTLGSLKRNVHAQTDVLPATVQPRSELPPSAIYLTTAGAPAEQGFWLAEGQFRPANIMGRDYEIYYGRRSLQLPFKLQLEEFKKTDYPGTETAMSFESRVKLNGTGSDIVVSMNEPFKHLDYTLYQSSYEIRSGQPRASIFSVNHDPGRLLKYLGSIVLGLGIIIFTLTRSRLAQKQTVNKGPSHA